MSLAIGTRLENRYRIDQSVGEGGMGEVYIATDERLQNKVAIKMVLSSQIRNNKIVQEFKKEAKRLSHLSHEAIPQIKDFFIYDNQHCLVMEFIEGDDLGTSLKQSNTPFAWGDVLDWADQILNALTYVHGEGGIHRDIKPSNLILTPRGRVKLLDFGISTGTIGEMTIVDTKTIGAVTTPYASIEQGIKRKEWIDILEIISPSHKAKVEELKNLRSEPTADIFSLGATLYQFLTKKLPSQSNLRAINVWGGKRDTLEHIRILNPRISQEIADVIMIALSLERKERPQTATEMRQMLKKAKANVLNKEIDEQRQKDFDKKIDELNSKWRIEVEETVQNLVFVWENKIDTVRKEKDKLEKKYKTNETQLEKTKNSLETEIAKREYAEFEKNESKAEKLKLNVDLLNLVDEKKSLNYELLTSLNSTKTLRTEKAQLQSQVTEKEKEVTQLAKKNKNLEEKNKNLTIAKNAPSLVGYFWFFCLVATLGVTGYGFRADIGNWISKIKDANTATNTNTNITTNSNLKLPTTPKVVATITPTATPTPEYDIPEIQANVTDFKLFEGKDPEPEKQKRTYGTAFIKSKTRYVWYELNLNFPETSSTKDIEIVEEWYKNEKKINSNKRKIPILVGDTETNLTAGYGSKSYGSYDTGKYVIIIRKDKKVIASQEFSVFK